MRSSRLGRVLAAGWECNGRLAGLWPPGLMLHTSCCSGGFLLLRLLGCCLLQAVCKLPQFCFNHFKVCLAVSQIPEGLVGAVNQGRPSGSLPAGLANGSLGGSELDADPLLGLRCLHDTEQAAGHAGGRG